MFQLLEKILEDYLSRQKKREEDNLGHIHKLAIFKKTKQNKNVQTCWPAFTGITHFAGDIQSQIMQYKF